MTDTIENQPMQLRENHRLYTTTRQRRRLAIENGSYGRGTDVSVTLCVVDRDTDWGDPYTQKTTYDTSLQYYGEIRVPQSIVDQLELEHGDNIRTTITVTDDKKTAAPTVQIR